MRTKHLWLAILAVMLYALHQDFWFWRSAHPLVLGFLPVGLFYHVCYTLAIAVLMWLLVKHAWPAHLEERQGEGGTRRQGEGGNFSPSPRLPVSPSQTEEGRQP